MPSEFSRDWLTEKVRATLVSHHIQVLCPSTDILVVEDHLVIITDGVNPLRPEDPPEVVDSDCEEVKEEKPKVEIPPLKTYNCQICTFENPISAAACDMCTSPRGPIEVLEEAWRKQHAPPEEPKPSKAAGGDPHRKALVADLRKLISREQEKTLLE